MELNKLKGNTYFIDAPTNIGVYVFKNKFCLLVDSGLDNSAARKIDDILKKNGLHPKYIINTHAHTDHYGGNHYFKENYTGNLVYTSEKESIYMKNSELFSTILFSSNAPKNLLIESLLLLMKFLNMVLIKSMMKNLKFYLLKDILMNI